MFDNLTITQAAEGLKTKQFTSTELTEFYISRIKKRDKTINAFLTVTDEIARNEAEEVDVLIADNQKLSPIAGIPCAIKDVICTKNIKTTAASKILEDFIPPYNATVVTKLKENHAIILGKTNCDEFAMGASTENSAYFSTKNPYDLTKVPGGSSGGSAAAVASDMCIWALGSDTGGSIRQPSSLCGVVGLKPTYGLVSRYGLISMASSLDQIGPITKTVEDAALILDVITGWDPFDATSLETKKQTYKKTLKSGINGLKIGVAKEYFSQGLDSGVKDVIKKAIAKLESCGGKIVEVSLPHQEYALAVYYLIMCSEVSANLARFDGIRFGKTRDYFGDEVKRRIILGTYALSAGYHDQYYQKATKVRSLIKKDFENAFKKVDVICGPVSPTVAWTLGEKLDDPLKMYLSDIYTVTANLVGIPAISVPAGSFNDLPVGLQIMAPHLREDLILRVGYTFENE